MLFPLLLISVRTASNLTVDRSVSHSRGTPTLSDRKSALPGGDDTGSIPEEMEHSVADSVVSDVGLYVADDDSMAEVLTGDNVKKPSGQCFSSCKFKFVGAKWWIFLFVNPGSIERVETLQEHVRVA